MYCLAFANMKSHWLFTLLSSFSFLLTKKTIFFLGSEMNSKESRCEKVKMLYWAKEELFSRSVKKWHGLNRVVSVLLVWCTVLYHFCKVNGIKALYLYHNWPSWYQFVTATFCHANWWVYTSLVSFCNAIFLL